MKAVTIRGVEPEVAAKLKSTEFCKVLVDAYPESLNIRGGLDNLSPIHSACKSSQVETVKYFLECHPEHIHMSKQ